MTLASAALKLAHRGLAVFPLEPGGKILWDDPDTIYAMGLEIIPCLGLLQVKHIIVWRSEWREHLIECFS